MKNNLENSIKESLKDFEMSYDPKAWEAMSAKLDAAQPSSSFENGMKESLNDLEMPYNPKAWEALRAKLDLLSPAGAPTSNFKWYAIAATAIVASVGAYFYFTHENQKAADQNLIVNNAVQTVENDLDGLSNTKDAANSNSSSADQGANNNVSVDENSSSAQQNSADNAGNSGENNVTTIWWNEPNSSQNQVSNSGSNGVNKGENGTDKPINNDGSNKVNFVSPSLASVCLNETTEIENNNSLKLWVIAPSGESFHVNPMSIGSFTASETGIHKIGYYHSNFVETGAFNVKSTPAVDFYIDKDQKYEDGVPVTKVETNVPGSAFNWKIGNTTAAGREAEGHFFKKGYYDITLDVTGANGCVNSKTEQVYIEHEYGDRGNYNLLAPSGIHLNSTDEKNRTFMPEGLKLREVKFRLVIYSLQDGHVVYETQDSSKPWNGVDQSTGRQVGHATSYHWEVTIENPMAGENPSYKGALTVLIN